MSGPASFIKAEACNNTVKHSIQALNDYREAIAAMEYEAVDNENSLHKAQACNNTVRQALNDYRGAIAATGYKAVDNANSRHNTAL